MAIPSFSSCVPQSPSTTYGTGTGIVIDPYLPQSNSFSAYSQIPVAVDSTVFTEAAKAAPTNSFFAKIAIAANQTDAFVTAYLQDNYPNVISTKTVEQSSIQQIPNPEFDIVAARRDRPPYMVPEFIPATRTVVETKKMFADMPFADVVAKVKTEKVLPMIAYSLGNQPLVTFATTPTVEPRLFVVEEYQVTAYLGKYGL
jgi:hypothetical protein